MRLVIDVMLIDGPISTKTCDNLSFRDVMDFKRDHAWIIINASSTPKIYLIFNQTHSCILIYGTIICFFLCMLEGLVLLRYLEILLLSKCIH